MNKTIGQSRRGGNQYIDHFPNFDKTPKTVIAAIAVSFALMQSQDDFEEAKSILEHEWHILYEARIVSQKPRI